MDSQRGAWCLSRTGRNTIFIGGVGPMMWQITAKTGERRGVSWSIGDQPLTLGRSLSCDITIADPTVSRRHCEIMYDGVRVLFRDLGSRNVTLVNGRIANECYLDVGDELSLGTDSFILSQAAPGASDPPATPRRSDDTTISLGCYGGGLASRSEGQGYPTSAQEMIQLYQFSQRLHRAKSRHELAMLSLPTIQELFPAPAEALVCFRTVDKRLEVYPRSANLSESTSTQVSRALQAGRSTLKLERRHAFKPKRQVCISPLCTSESTHAAFAVISTGRDSVLDERDLARLDALAGVAALHLATLGQRNAFLAADQLPNEKKQPEFLGISDDIAALRAEIQAAAQTRLHTLITGEVGTGKERAAQMIHRHSTLPRGTLISANCESISGAAFTHTLLGKERPTENGGRIIDAGLLDQANGGTLVLREIAALTEENQRLLARTLARRTFTRFGSTGEVSFHGRIIATSRTELEALVREGSFRTDLLKAVSRQRLHITPLRQRRTDIRALAQHFFKREKQKNARPIGKLTEDALGYLEELPLRGNALELRQTISRAVQGENPQWIQDNEFGSKVAHDGHVHSASLDPLENAEKTLITAVVRQCGGDTTQAARILGIARLEVERIAKMASGFPPENS